MFRLFDRFLINTHPPPESEVFALLCSDDFINLSNTTILKAAQLLLDTQYPIGVDTENKRGKFIWEIDVLVRYSIIKADHHAKEFNTAINLQKYTQREKDIQCFLVEIFRTVFQVIKKGTRNGLSYVHYFTIQYFGLHPDQLVELGRTTSNVQILLYLVKLQKEFEMQFPDDFLRFETDLNQTNNIASLIDDSISDDRFGQNIQARHFSLFQYQNQNKYSVIVDFETLDPNSNSHVSITNFLKENNINVSEQKKEKQFHDCVMRFTIFKALKQGLSTSQYLIAFLDHLDSPLFEYRWLKAKDQLSPEVNDLIQFKIQNGFQLNFLYSNEAMQEFFYKQYDSEFEFIISYPIEEKGSYSSQYKDSLVRNMWYCEKLLSKSCKTNSNQVERNQKLILKLFEFLDHLIENPQKYEDIKLGTKFEKLNFSYDLSACKKLWEKLKGLKSLHRVILKNMFVLVEYVLSDTINEEMKQNHSWKMDLYKKNRALLIKVLNQIQSCTFLEEDIEIFADLLKDKDFKFRQKIFDSFLEYFSPKGWLLEEIKAHAQQNVLTYNTSGCKLVELKVLTTEQRMTSVAQKAHEFKQQRKQIEQIRAKYGSNAVLDQCFFENFEHVMDYMTGKFQKLVSRDMSAGLEERLDLFFNKTLQIQGDTLYIQQMTSIPGSFQLSQILEAIGTIVLNNDIQRTGQIFKYILKSFKILQQIAYEGKFSYQQLSRFVQLCLVAKIGNESYDCIDTPVKKQITEEKMTHIKRILIQLIDLGAEITNVNLECLVDHCFRSNMTNSEKIDAEIEIISSFCYWEDLDRFELEFHKKVHFIDRVRDFGYYIVKLTYIEQVKLNSLIVEIYEERVLKEEINNITEGEDTQLFLSAMRLILRFYFWQTRTMNHWYIKHSKILQILERIQKKSLAESRYLMTHTIQLFQTYIATQINTTFRPFGKSDHDLEQTLEIIFRSSKLTGFTPLFQNQTILKEMKDIIEYRIGQRNIGLKAIKLLTDEKEIEEKKEKLDNMTFTPLKKFMVKLFEHIDQIWVGSSLDTFFNFTKQFVKQEQSAIFNQMIKYLNEKKIINQKEDEKTLPIEINVEKLRSAMDTYTGLLNSLIFLNQWKGIIANDKYLELLCSKQLFDLEYSQNVLKFIQYLNQEQLEQAYQHYKTKIVNLIQNPNPDIPKNTLLWTIQITLYTQAQLTLYFPKSLFKPYPFIDNILSLYNTKNQLGDVSFYIILAEMTPEKYRYNFKQTLILMTKQFAKNNYLELDIKDHQVDIQSVKKVLQLAHSKIVQTLPFPFNNTLFYPEIIQQIIDGKMEQVSGESYSYLSKIIITSRTTYTETNLFMSLINLVNTNPHILHTLLKKIQIEDLLNNIQFSEGYIISIIEQISYLPQLFYPLLDSLISRLTKNKNIRSFLNIVRACINNLTNIINQYSFEKAQHYLGEFRAIIYSLAKQPLTKKLFHQLSVYSVVEIIDDIIWVEYKLRVFKGLKVFPLKADLEFQLSNKDTFFKEKKKEQDFQSISMKLETVKNTQIKSQPLSPYYLYWYQFKSRADMNRKPEEILIKMFQDLQFPVSEKEEENKEEDVKENEQSKQEEKKEEDQYDSDFITQMGYNKSCDASSEKLIEYLKINRQEFMQVQNKYGYMQEKIQEVFTVKRKQLKRLIVASEMIEMNGEKEFKVDLKQEEKMINQESDLLWDMNFRDFSILRENETLRFLDLTPEALKVINGKRGEEQQNKQEEELVQQEKPEIQTQTKIEEQKIQKSQSHLQQKTQQTTTDTPQQKQQVPQQKQEVSQQKQQTKQPEPESQQQAQQKIEDPLSDLLANTTKNTSIISDYICSLKIYQSCEQLPDQIICFIVYEMLNGGNTSEHQCIFSGRQNHMKICNLLMRLLSDSMKGTKYIPTDIFSPKQELYPTKLSSTYFQQFERLTNIYPCLFVDTNSSQFTVVSYTREYEVDEEKEPVTISFNPVKLFPFPEENSAIITILKQIKLFADTTTYDLDNLIQKALNFIAQASKTILFPKQEKKIYEIIIQTIIEFCKLHPNCISGVDNYFYQIEDVPFPDDMIGLHGGFFELAMKASIQSLEESVKNIQQLKAKGIAEINYSNIQKYHSQPVNRLNSGSIVDSEIERIKKKQWFKTEIYLEAYGLQIANLLKNIYDFRRLTLKEEDTENIALPGLQNCLLNPQFQRIRTTFDNNEQQTTDLLSFNKCKQIKPKVDQTPLNQIDKMLLNQIETHGDSTINQGETIFSFAPEILSHYNTANKAELFHNCLSDQYNSQIDFVIKRDEVVVSTVRELSKHDIKKVRDAKFAIKFLDEVGIDGGGLTNEYIQLFVQEITNFDNGIFSKTEGFLVPSIFSTKIIGYKEIFRTIGRLLGKCIGENLLSTSVQLQPYIIKLLYGDSVGTLEDMKDVDEKLYNNFKWILDNDVEETQMTFEILSNSMDSTTTVELIENGKNINVTNENKGEYVDRYVYWLLIDSIKKQLYELILGFKQTSPTEYIRSIFTYVQFQKYILGDLQFDVELYKKQVTYKNCNSSTLEIKWLFELLSEMNEQEVIEYLVFVTGMKRLPVEKFRDFIITLTLKSDSLPTSNTCSNKVNLGLYTTKEILKDKLQKAMRETKGFHSY